MFDPRRRHGHFAEFLVWAWLALRGWSAVGRRVRIAGVEADLVMRRGNVLALIEVKYRFRPGPPPAQLVTARQRRRLARAARILAARWGHLLVRIDLAEVTWRPPRIRVHEAAWSADNGSESMG